MDRPLRSLSHALFIYFINQLINELIYLCICLFIYLFIHPYIFFLTYLFSFISGAVLESPSCLQGEWVYLGGGGVPPYKKTVESEGSRKAQIN